MKRIVRLTENDLHKIVKESVNKILKEEDWNRFKATCPKCGSKDTGFINMGGGCCGHYCHSCGNMF